MSLRPTRVLHAEERLDEPRHDAATLERSLAHVAAVNRWLGGWRALRGHLGALLPATRPARVLDIGTGSADGPAMLARWARSTGRALHIVATDVHPQMLEVARRRTGAFPEIRVQAADALALPFPDRSFDAALLTLTLHHLEGDDQLRVLREMARVATWVVVGELDRSWLNYIGAKLLAWTLWRRNPITRHDGPLSVLRAYTAAELLELARAAGLVRPRVSHHPFQRLVLVGGGAARGPGEPPPPTPQQPQARHGEPVSGRRP
ncbi:MAG: methyltransferase domain-containing protein [Gemmatimonadetes bacterium]|nr:methyltransferase domain-containing protein [Gemmatimonadota bacterium]